MNKLYIVSLICCLLTINTYAQQARQDMGGGPRIGRLYGKVVDAKSKQAVEFATVTLLAMQKDSVIGGGLASSNGDFNMTNLPFGQFRLRISFIGYQNYEQQVSVTPQRIEQDLGNIGISIDAKVLNEVVVEGERANVVMAVDRRVYSVDKDLSARGGTGIDAVKNIPGLTVDADGSVALRNSSPTIFVDGRPTNLTLEQIPSDAIDRIEVITNPSAKFDASTTGGILNIIMKKNTKPGYNGMVTAGVGFPRRYNLNGSLNIKEGKGNLGINYSLNSSLNTTRGYTDRTSLLNGTEVGYFNQNNNNQDNRLFQNGRISYDYNFTNRTMGTVSAGFMGGGGDSKDEQNFTQRDGARNMLTNGNRFNEQEMRWSHYNAKVELRHTYPKAGKEWTSDLTYNRGERKNNSDFITNNYDFNGVLLAPGEQYQRNNGSGNSNNITFQFDFVNPITDTAKWEFGVRSNYKEDNNFLTVTLRDSASGEMVRDTMLSNNYRVTELVNAAYVTYSNMLFGSIAYQAGLRFEQTRFEGEILGKNQTFQYYYPNGTKNLAKAFFPSKA
jgi:iron complex outermembrane receptor protein